MQALNDLMGFDHVIQVHEDGSITEPGIHAPELADGHIYHDKWSFFTGGYSGQYGYSGPIMHPSEYIGGRLEKDIRETPGYFVALVNSSPDDDEPDGWAVAYMPAD
jgi:hypothetical protein